MKRSLNTVSTAALTRFSTICSSRPSSSDSISTLPIVDAGSASRSLTRGATSRSPWRSARRAALATSVSWFDTVRRTDTPERWLMCGLCRARCESVATISVMYSGTVTRMPSASSGRASCAAMATSVVDVERVVRADLGAEAVLQRRDDAAAVRVVLGVGRRDQQHVERQADLVAPHLDVALLEHVEQADLDALGEVGQLVDGEDAAVGAGHEAVVQRELVGEVAALGHLDRVDLADEVGDRRVGRGQLLAEARLRWTQSMGVSSPCSATRSRAWRDTGL